MLVYQRVLYIQCGAPKIAKLVQKTPITHYGYGTQTTIVMGVYKPTNITGGPHIVYIYYPLVNEHRP